MQGAESDRTMRSHPRRDCYLCGSPGRHLHEGMWDAMGNVDGLWSFQRCTNPECDLVWLDPVPEVEEIHKAYRVYYTHDSASSREHAPVQGQESGSAVVRAASALLRKARFYDRVRQEHQARSALYLGDLPPGRLLEVGCGNGERLERMTERGWVALGQEVDAASAEVARARGVEVRLGWLQELGFPAASFDAIVMIHTIEHLHDPVSVLAECHRILKPGGRIVLITPNVASYGHRRLMASWQGLDPPRHLYCFSQRSLRNVTLRAGFPRPKTWTTEVNSFASFAGSLRHRKTGSYLPKGDPGLGWRLQARAFEYWATLTLMADPDSGEEVILSAVK